jgi:disulfide bond formation protein DsbB
MEREPLLVLGVLLGLLAAAGIARRFVAVGWQKNALSVALVVLALLTAFTVFFAFGELMRSSQPPAKPKASAFSLPTPFALAWVSSPNRG